MNSFLDSLADGVFKWMFFVLGVIPWGWFASNNKVAWLIFQFVCIATFSIHGKLDAMKKEMK